MPTDRQIQLQEIDWQAPAFALFVEDVLVAGGLSPERRQITQDTISLEFDHSLTLANELALTIANPDDRYTDNPLFAPGNEVELHLGYGTDPQFVGRGVITRHLPNFPAGEVDTLQIKALDPTHRMMREEYAIQGSKSVNTKKQQGIFEVAKVGGTDIFATAAVGGSGGNKPKKQTSGRVWKGTLGQICKSLCEPYGIRVDIDPALAKVQESFPQKRGTSDYEILRALANLYGAEFFVEWEPSEGHRGTTAAVKRVQGSGRWVARFRKSREFAGQDSKIVFRRGGTSPTLIACQLDFAVDESVNEVEVLLYDRKARGWRAVQVEEKPGGVKRIRFSRGVVAKGGPQGPIQAGQDLPEITSMSALRLSVEGHGVDVRTPRKFRSAADAKRWADQWIKAHKDAFVTAQGTVIGVPDLRAGQTHQLEGIGKRFSGDYYFTQVKHRFTSEAGYVCDFTANKVITQ